MAYSKSRRSPQRKKRGVRRFGGQRSRKSRTTRRTYRKKGAMSKKRILNVTSRKKRDTMLPWTNVTQASQSGSTVYTTDAAQLAGNNYSNTPAMFIWSPTARDLNRNAGTGSVIDMAARSATLCYMRGLKEAVEIQVTSGLPWQWRRIVFTAKGFSNLTPTTPSFQPYHETSQGMMRTINQPGAVTRTAVEQVLFKGSSSIDWRDPIIAPTDSSRVTIRYDKVLTIASGNDEGVMRRYNRWHGFNKNLRYDDDETGDSMTTQNWSVIGKEGMGDVFIVDYFRSRFGAATDDILFFNPNATLYWHEK
uniref:Capsid protein n=1 Tax=Prunella montanella Genomoviridae sp. TaxID=2814991 RepID=A0A8E7G2C3_9VIRU|nr:MAG: capsid protein [Gemycircularvirus]